MSKSISETVNEQTVNEPECGELSEKELEKVTGGVSNIMMTKHDTVKNTISNIH